MTPQQPQDWSRQLHKGLHSLCLHSVPALPWAFCMSHPFASNNPLPPGLPSMPSGSPRAFTPTSSHQQCPVVARGRAVITHCNPFFPLLIYYYFFWVSDVEKWTGWSLSMYLVSAACWKVMAKNEKWAREEFRKYWKAVGQIKSNSTVVLLVLIELHQETTAQMFHWFVSRQLVIIF